jgi:hypothetical protein
MRQGIDLLFYGGDLRQTLENHRKALLERIDNLSANQLNDENIEATKKHFIDEFAVAPLELKTEDLALEDPKEVERTVQGNWGPITRKALFYKFRIPFTGDSSLFSLQPSTYNMNPPRGAIEGSELIYIQEREDRDRESIQREIQNFINFIQQYLDWQEPMVENWNAELPHIVEKATNDRKDKLLADKQLIDGLGFRIIRNGQSPRATSVPLKRKQITPLPQAKPGKAYAKDPTLDVQVYEDILEMIDSMSLTMERSPSTFYEMGEEAIRDLFLMTLNSNYQGKASGETFNAAGKTDILIKHEDRILFIAECKFWTGPKSLTAAIDQLLSYTTWRDTKTALLLFNRNQDFSSMLEKITPGFEAHSQFVRTESYANETGFRFIMKHPNDTQRHLTVTALAFNIPTKS